MKIRWAVLIVLAMRGGECPAYDTNTHNRLTVSAVAASELQMHFGAIGLGSIDAKLPNNTLTLDFGLVTEITHFPFRWDPTQTPHCFGTPFYAGQSIESLIALGAYCEDATDFAFFIRVLRFTNHFYDPVNGGAGLFPGISSLTWGTEPTMEVFSQDFSYRDFKNYLSEAVVSMNAVTRQRSMANAFRALGHVMHLVEDLAQPQHTRSDSHGVPGSFYEAYTEQVFASLPYAGYNPSDISVGLISDIWHTGDGKGLADYSNRGFVTKNTNFRGSDNRIQASAKYGLPNGDGAVLRSVQIQDLAQIAKCPGPEIPRSLIGDLTFIETPVADRVTHADSVNPRTSTYSLFDEDLQNYGFSKTFTLNRYNFCEAHKLLIPRAVGYAAALINYAFRGSLKISLLDHGVAAMANSGDLECKLACGFGLIKAKVSNATLGGEKIGAGTLVAVVRYHRNSCFHPDLSGQPGAPNYLGVACRVPAVPEPLNEYVSVSKEISTGEISESEPLVLSMDFSAAPIPFDATDVYLQVMFRGQLGEETDGIALGSLDLAEPTFLTFSNDYDSINVYGADGAYKWSEVVPTRDSSRIEQFKITSIAGGGDSSLLASLELLNPGLFARIAILTDAPTFGYRIEYRYGGADPQDWQSQTFEVETARMQVNDSDLWAHFPDYVTLRQYRANEWVYQPSTEQASIYWVLGDECEAGHPDCVPEDKTVGDRVRRFPQFFQPNPVPMKIDFNETHL